MSKRYELVVRIGDRWSERHHASEPGVLMLGMDLKEEGFGWTIRCGDCGSMHCFNGCFCETFDRAALAAARKDPSKETT